MLRNILIASFLLLPISVWADTIFLENGTTIDGIIKARHKQSIELQIGKIGRIFIDVETIQSIEKNDRDGTINKSTVSIEGKRNGISRIKKNIEGKGKGGKQADKGSEEEGNLPKQYLKKDDVDPELADTIKQLIKDLKRQKNQYRVRAERKLLAIGEPAVPFLVEVTENQNPLVRIAVMRLFKKIGNKIVIEPCINHLSDENEYVRKYAVEVLRSITGHNFGYKSNATKFIRKKKLEIWSKWYEKEKEKEQNKIKEQKKESEPVRGKEKNRSRKI